MRIVAYKLLVGLLVVLSGIFAGCNSGDELGQDAYYIPAPRDYSEQAMWVVYTNDNDGTGADVFYIPSTWEYDWTTADGTVCHYADVNNQKHLDDMAIEMHGVADYMADGNNFYSPYYRHITLDTWATLNEDTISKRYHDVSFKDVKAAYEYFRTHYNAGRPFILAGFSQGAKSVVELMKIMSEEDRTRMVAAYVLGYKITPDDIKIAPWIKAAMHEDDTGVTICYNSVSDVKFVKPVVASPNVMCINPVNWRTDATPAILDDTVTVTLSPEFNVLVLDGYDGSYLPNILGILNVGDYHGIEPWVYSESLRQNFKTRTKAFRAAL